MPEQAPKKGAARHVLLDYWRHSLRYPWFVISLFVVGALIQVAVIVSPLFLKDFIDIISVASPTDATPGIVTALWLFALFTFLAWGLRRLQFLLIAKLESRVMSDLSTSSFNYIINHSYHFFVSNFVGSLVRRVTRYAKSYEVIADAILFQLFPGVLLAGGIIFILYLRHPLLGLGLAVWLVLFLSLQIFLINRIHSYRVKAAEDDSAVTGVLSDALSNQSTAALFSGIRHERRRFAESVGQLQKSRYRAWRSDDNVWAIQGFLIATVNIGLLFGALVLWRRGLLSVGDFVLIQTYLLTLFERLVQAGREIKHVFSAIAEATEMSEILRIPHEIRDNPDAVPLVIQKGEIVFDNVDFKYFDGHPVLSKFSLIVKGGEKVAFVGPSGAGKTTVTKLLLRLYEITGGEIRIDGQNINTVTLESLRKHIGFVPQDPVLFHRNLLENIRYGRQDATEEEVMEAAKRAHCHEFILRMPHGYQTLVGERGIKLSGGERQRIAIARAILKNAPILVLDEATSALDSESESLIQDAFETLMEGKTVIAIAHRLSTVIKMDRIVVIEEGKVTAEGSHEDLLAQEGRYQTLWNIQAGGFTDENAKEGEDI